MDHVAAVMITQQGREHLARMSVASFLGQTWDDSHLYILNTGPDAVLTPELASTRITEIQQLQGTHKLSDLRNLLNTRIPPSSWSIQWDDDDWSHPDRIAYQMRFARQGQAVILKSQLRIHTKEKTLIHFNWDWKNPDGIPGTVLLPPQEQVSYSYQPGLARHEDTYLLRDWFGSHITVAQNQSMPHLYLRLFHGSNTWDANHFFLDRQRTPLSEFPDEKARTYVEHVFRTYLSGC